MIFFAAILKIPLKNFKNESDIHVFILFLLESSDVFNMSCDTSVFVLRYHNFFFFFKKKRQQNTNYWEICLSRNLQVMKPLKIYLTYFLSEVRSILLLRDLMLV